MKNMREKGGTGKLRSFWEEALFQVIEKRDNIPVYKIQNLKNSSDVRQIHRNLLMKCNDLPVDVFDEEDSTDKQKKNPLPNPVRKKKARKSRNTPVSSKENQTETQDQGSDESDNEMLVIHHRVLSQDAPEVVISEDGDEEVNHGLRLPGVVDDNIGDGLENNQLDYSDASAEHSEHEEEESFVEVGTSMETNNDTVIDAEPEETDEEESEESSSDSELPRRILRQDRMPTRVFTYDDDGNPVWEERWRQTGTPNTNVGL